MANGDETAPVGEPAAEEQADEHVKAFYKQAFFLSLAAKGKEAWNAWRRDPVNQRESVDFAGVDFSKAPMDTIDFAGFEFGHWVDFSHCVWRGVPWQFGGYWQAGYGFGIRFDPKAFRAGRANFIGAKFGPSAFFIDAAFGDEAFFDQSSFEAHPSFAYATFGDGACFTGADFGSWTSFHYTTFGDGANFNGATFRGPTTFNGTAFGGSASFDSALFKGSVMFIGDPKPNENADVRIQRHRRLWEYRRIGPDGFQSISFESARFESSADFSSRTFDGVIDFANALFFRPPIFHNASNVAQIDFSGTRIKFAHSGERQWTSDNTIPIRMRALRKIAEETKNHDLERNLFVEERNAERGVYWRQYVKELKAVSITEKPRVMGRLLTHCLWIVVLFGYGALADYGRRFERPLAWLVLSVCPERY